MYPFYLGINLHLKRSYMALMKANGEPIDRRRLRNTEVAATHVKRAAHQVGLTGEAPA
jgi:hypothetical protein